MSEWNLWAGWAGMIGGLVSGAMIGLFFHRAEFAGGYGSFRRRLLRLGHIAFFGLGIINVLFALTVSAAGIVVAYQRLASASLVAAVFLMPLVCFLTAWRAWFRHAFALPVVCVAIALVLMLQGVLTQ